MKPTMSFFLCLSLLLASGCKKAAQTVLGYQEPSWTSVVRLSDGRVFVTDTHIALDVVWAKPDNLPSSTYPSEGIEYVIERHTLSGSARSFSVSSVVDVGVDGAYRGEGGVLLDPKYIDYLQWQFAMHDVQLFSRSPNEDVVISIDGEFAGALAPMKLER